MHYRGLLRVARRDSGVRVYEVREPEPAVTSPMAEAAEMAAAAKMDALVDVIVRKYAPLPASTLGSRVLFAIRRAAVDQGALGGPGARQTASRPRASGGIDWLLAGGRKSSVAPLAAG